MLTLPGYSKFEQIHDQPHVLVFRALRESTGESVLIKLLRAEYPSAEELARYENEFNLLKRDLGEGVPKAIEMIQVDKTRVMVIEDIGGKSLQLEMGERKLTVAELLDLSVLIVKSLGRIQEQNIIHSDIKPANIVFNRRTGRLQIIDFGLAAVAKEIEVDKEKRFSGTLQYMSPEQTGRTQRSVDYRSDYYSLGVTLYQLFSGQLPFNAADEMEWIHSHIAQTETPLHIVKPQIPKPVSLIVQKLMRKSPEERYQSCLGILADLQACRDMVDQGQGIENFVPGQKDISAEFRLSTKLYGREAEVEIVNTALSKTILGSKRMILVGGEPGVGKSSIANVIKDGTKSAQGYFIFGKYDQFRKDVPFSAMISAFNQLVSQILAEDEKQIREWKTRIMDALGVNASVVTSVLPQMKLILGDVHDAPELQGNELKQRFQMTFHNFIRACCLPGRPLVIFLDDLQWADSASRALLLTFLTEKEASSLLMVGAYRDNEVVPGHPLLQLIRDLQEDQVTIDRITLSRLQKIDVQNMLVDSFSADPENCEKLADLVYAKTEGNPFFVSQFLKNLYEKNLLRFRASEGWFWDLEELGKQEMTSNVLDLLGEKIAQLPLETRSLLTLASCFGNYFRAEELKIYNQKSDEENVKLLEPAISNGLILPADQGAFKFIHDRVQEAAYTALSTDQREKIHWQIANRLLSLWDQEKIRNGIFYLVNHWNAGAKLIENQTQREKSAELNLTAATVAQDSAVTDLAFSYSVQGLTLLASEDWKKYEHFLRPLYMIRAEAEFILGKHDDAEQNFIRILKRTRDPLLKAPVYCALVELKNIQNLRKEAIEWGRKGLATLGVRVPRNPSVLRVAFMLLRVRAKTLKFLKNPWVESVRPQKQILKEIMELYSSLAVPAYQYNKNLLAYTSMQGLMIAMNEKFLELNGRSFLATMIWQKLHRFAEARRIGDHITPWFDRHDLDINAKRSFYIFGGFSMPILYTHKEAIKVMERGTVELYQAGDVIYSSTCSQYIASISVFSETKLERARARVEECFEFIERVNYVFGTSLTIGLLQFIKALRGENPNPFSIVQEGATEESVEAEFLQQESKLPVSWFYMNSMLLKYIMGDYEGAFAFKDKLNLAHDLVSFATITMITRGLSARLKLKFSANADRKQRKKLLKEALKELKYFKKLAEHNPNYKAGYLMILAEDMWQKNERAKATELLEAAIKAGQQSEMQFFGALANEQMAEYFLAQNMEKAAMMYLREALFFYETWGASAKVQLMIEKFPNLNIIYTNRLSGSASSTMTSTHVSLDINTVLKASNTLTSEMDMTKLVNKLLNILIENAGAERGVLVLLANDQLIIRGQRHVQDKEEFKLIEIPVNGYKDISRSLISYVARTHETVVMSDASSDDRVARDEYVKRAKVLSTICLPIVAQSELKGMVYLENNSATGVFSPDRVELLQTLAGQIAISIENATLYQQQAETIRMQNELATAHAVQEMLFPKAEFKSESASISGYYRPATECGGDWWYYSQLGDWTYIWIGDATGHGAPAALVTSAACSAVAVAEGAKDISPESAMKYLNQAICRTTKGKINMTFFVGALNSRTGEFKFVRASHDPPYLIRNDKKSEISNFAAFRGHLEPLQGINGRRLGENSDEVFESKTIQLKAGDTILFYTDGLPDIVNPEERPWGERGFLSAFHEGFSQFESTEEITAHIVKKADEFGRSKELADDITICVLKYLGSGVQTGKKAA